MLLDLLKPVVIFCREENQRWSTMARHRYRLAAGDVAELADALLEIAGTDDWHAASNEGSKWSL